MKKAYCWNRLYLGRNHKQKRVLITFFQYLQLKVNFNEKKHSCWFFSLSISCEFCLLFWVKQAKRALEMSFPTRPAQDNFRAEVFLFWKSFPAHPEKCRESHQNSVRHTEMLGDGHFTTDVIQTITTGKKWIL